jgi:hypothetical protein
MITKLKVKQLKIKSNHPTIPLIKQKMLKKIKPQLFQDSLADPVIIILMLLILYQLIANLKKLQIKIPRIHLLNFLTLKMQAKITLKILLNEKRDYNNFPIKTITLIF